MYQTFEDRNDNAQIPARLAALRGELASRGVNGFIVPRADEHQNEYVAPNAERLAWLTGFTGSAGTAVVLPDKAALFVDGRYTLQARSQSEDGGFEIVKTPETKPSAWITKNMWKGGKLGYDPRLHTRREIDRLTKALKKSGVQLTPLVSNPFDVVWGNRPERPLAPVVSHPIEYAGRPAEEKIADLKAALERDEQDAVVLSSPDTIAWLFNLRGGDIPRVPVALAYAIVPAKGMPTLFVDSGKIDRGLGKLLDNVVEILEPDAFEMRLEWLGDARSRVRLDPDSTNARIATLLEESGAEIVEAQDPCARPKAIKNDAEIAGARAAHIRDAVALARFLAWFDSNAQNEDEIGAVRELEELRKESGQLRDVSFDTIGGSGPNGAIVHYRVTHSTNRKLDRGSLFLIDSGAQYPDGTTDVTRTVAVGKPTEQMRRDFTLVLKGHIAVASARFPKRTRGQDLDPFARRALWLEGLDFDHGTGHGVGSYLCVHEGPQRLSRLGSAELEPGMIVSIEPGLYREGKYGIRIENLVLVTPLAPIEGGDREMMGFEPLTLAPIDTRLVNTKLMQPAEIAWLNAYHAQVRAALEPRLIDSDRKWLHRATKPVR